MLGKQISRCKNNARVVMVATDVLMEAVEGREYK